VGCDVLLIHRHSGTAAIVTLIDAVQRIRACYVFITLGSEGDRRTSDQTVLSSNSVSSMRYYDIVEVAQCSITAV